MTKKRAIIVIAVIVSAAVIGIWLWRVIAVNLQYPPAKVTTYEMGETATVFDEYEITALDAEFVPEEKAREWIDVSDDYLYLVVTLKIKNISDKKTDDILDQNYSWMAIPIQSGAFQNGPLIPEKLNNWESTPQVLPGEQITCKVLYSIFKERFPAPESDSLMQRDYELVLRLYPEKQAIRLDRVKGFDKR